MIGLLSVAGIVLLVDQGSKSAVRAWAGDRRVAVGPLLAIRPVQTIRPGFGRHHGRVSLVVGWVAALACAIALQQTGAGPQGPAAAVGLGAAIGGAAGNLVDILRRHAVTDFIDLGWWPVFNLADVGIVAGLLAAFAPRV